MSNWKDAFFYCKIPRGVQLSGFWKPDKIVEGVGPSSPEGFKVLNMPEVIRMDFVEENIPRGGEADYHGATDPSGL